MTKTAGVVALLTFGLASIGFGQWVLLTSGNPIVGWGAIVLGLVLGAYALLVGSDVGSD